ncbi:hypothetical protein BDQ12DRAFT_670209 [Crucibulum laeve]|uniref:Uncharacterized protein n=1 Tax=Crucibulum laeve TaxID=68775 RepID=A0A5C3LLE6_9AGAR|nr:hypothetical protein BDQ12DRAFT_670209 [Crucibulum laeve]
MACFNISAVATSNLHPVLASTTDTLNAAHAALEQANSALQKIEHIIALASLQAIAMEACSPSSSSSHVTGLSHTNSMVTDEVTPITAVNGDKGDEKIASSDDSSNGVAANVLGIARNVVEKYKTEEEAEAHYLSALNKGQVIKSESSKKSDKCKLGDNGLTKDQRYYRNALDWSSTWEGIEAWPKSLKHYTRLAVTSNKLSQHTNKLMNHKLEGQKILLEIDELGGNLPELEHEIRELWIMGNKLSALLAKGLTLIELEVVRILKSNCKA